MLDMIMALFPKFLQTVVKHSQPYHNLTALTSDKPQSPAGVWC